jgi:hypothetical protein
MNQGKCVTGNTICRILNTNPTQWGCSHGLLVSLTDSNLSPWNLLKSLKLSKAETYTLSPNEREMLSYETEDKDAA